MLSCSPVRTFLRRKNIYFRSENGSSKPSHRISHFQLELDKLPYVITRLKPIRHRWNANHSWENAWHAAQPLKDASSLTEPQLPPPQTHPYTHRHPRTPPAVPGVLCIPLFSPFLSFFKAWPAFLNLLLFLTHTHSFFFYSKAAPAWIRGRWFASCKACDLHRITQINSPKFILSNQHTNLH